MLGCKHPTIASGATPIGSAGRAPDRKRKVREGKKKFIYFLQEEANSEVYKFFEPIPGCKHPTIASGATPIGSAGHAPNENFLQV